jgi:hypothetical protein
MTSLDIERQAGFIELAPRVDGFAALWHVGRSVAAAAFGTPTFLFKGNAAAFANNAGTGGSFTQTGTVTDFTPGP